MRGGLGTVGEVARGVVVAHSDLAGALIRAVERITGVSDALVAVSNEAKGPEEMRRAIEAACGQGPTVVFTDLASGSCALAGRFVTAAGARALVTGANLPMLLDFVFHRELALEPLVDRLVRKGREGIGAAGAPSGADRVPGVDRPASG